MHEAWLQTRSVLLSRLPADPDIAAEPALAFVPDTARLVR